jgi:hypothetical protein
MVSRPSGMKTPGHNLAPVAVAATAGSSGRKDSTTMRWWSTDTGRTEDSGRGSDAAATSSYELCRIGQYMYAVATSSCTRAGRPAGRQQPESKAGSYRSLPLALGGSLTSLTRDHPAAVTPSLYVTDTVCVGHMYPTIALP